MICKNKEQYAANQKRNANKAKKGRQIFNFAHAPPELRLNRARLPIPRISRVELDEIFFLDRVTDYSEDFHD